MRILHIGQMIGGLEVYIRNTILYSSNEFEYIIICGRKDEPKPILKNGHKIREYKVDLYRKISLFDLLCLFQILKIVRKEKPDLIHCHSSKGGFLGRIVGAICRVQTCYTPHAFSFLSTQKKINKGVYVFIEKITRFRTYLLACSCSEAKLAKDTVGYAERYIRIWSNSVPDASGCAAKIEQNREQQYISTIGRPSYQKNTLFLLSVVKEIVSRGKDIKFCILGVGHYSPKLEEVKQFIKKNKIEKNILLLPWLSQTETHKYILNSEVYVSTSMYEGLPLGIIEALSLGKPIVASNVYGNTDCVEDGKNGYLLNLEKDIFATKLIELLDDKNKLVTFGNNSRAIYDQEFNIETRIHQLEAIYKEMAG